MSASKSHHPLAHDLDAILVHTKSLWEELRGQSLFLTGGTGFFGTWLLESFAWANDALQLNANIMVLTRNPEAFAKKCPHLYHHPAIRFHQGDVRNFAFPQESFTHVIHAATDASATLNESNPLLMLDTIIDGTRHALDFAVASGAKQFLLISSGAVYGRQSPTVTYQSEQDGGSPALDDPRSAYGVGKCTAEHLGCLYAKQYGLEVKIARCFAFVGPYLPLDIHFAIGNFIRDGLAGDTIRIGGDGSPYRSYLYAADLVIWLWTILGKGVSLRPYNVGSDEGYSIAEVANLVASVFDPAPDVHIAKQRDPNRLPERYVPNVNRAREELGLIPRTPLVDAVKSTVTWYENKFHSVVRQE